MKKIMYAFIIVLVMCVCGLVVSLLCSSCDNGNPSFRKDIIGKWFCLGQDKARESMAFMGVTFDSDNAVRMYVGKDTYNGNYSWKGNKVCCDFENGVEHTEFDVKDIYIEKVVGDVTEWAIIFDLYFDGEFYMEFTGTKVETD